VSLNALASRVGTSNQQISHLELGKRHLTVEWLQRLAAALDCHPWEIVSDTKPSDARETELLRLFRSLSRERQDTVLSKAAALAHPGEKRRSE
jgi:transcriptional regulator with XRE-family HTH domain